MQAGDVAAQVLAQVDAAFAPEAGHRPARARLERVEPRTGTEEDAGVVAVLPVHDAAVHADRLLARAGERVEGPQLPPGGRVEREGLEPRGGAVEHRAHDDRVALDLGPVVRPRVTRVMDPGNRQPSDVAAVDLVERRELGVAGVAAVGRPSPAPVDVDAPRRGGQPGHRRERHESDPLRRSFLHHGSN